MMTFRDFMNRNGRPLSEMAYKTSITGDFPVSQPAANLLSFIPDKDAQAKALHWIMTQGLYEASKGRHELAKIATQKLGRHVYDHEVFSPKAHAAYPDLKALYDSELKSLWDTKYEPKEIHYPTRTGVHVVNLADLNKTLENRYKMEPFRFGGPDGMIEYLEDGDWAEPINHQSPISTGPNDGAHHLRHGLDLSNPEMLHDKQTGKHFMRFGSQENPTDRWSPPATSNFEQKIKDMRFHSDRAHTNILQGADASHGAHGDWLRQNQQHLKNEPASFDQQYPFPTKGGSEFSQKGNELQFTNPDEYKRLKDTIIAGLHQVNKNKKPGKARASLPPGYDPAGEYGAWTDDDINNMIGQYFSKEKEGRILPKVNDPLFKRVRDEFGKTLTPKDNAAFNKRSYIHTKRLLDAGRELPDSPKFDAYLNRYKLSGIPYKDFINPADYDLHPVDIKDFLDGGWKAPEDWEPGNSREVRLTSPEMNKTIDLLQGEDGKWLQKTPKPEKRPLSIDKDSGSPLLMKSGKLSTGEKFSAPVDAKRLDQFQKQWTSNPTNFGDKSEGGIMKSVHDAADLGKYLATRNNENLTSAIINSKFPHQDLIGWAQIGMTNLYGSFKFRFGDFNPSEAEKGREKDIYSLLSQAGVTDEAQAKQYIDSLMATIKSGKSPSPQSMPPAVYNAFIQNGYRWRVGKAASYVAEKIREELAKGARERSGQEQEGGDGKTFSKLDTVQNQDRGRLAEPDDKRGGKIRKRDLDTLVTAQSSAGMTPQQAPPAIAAAARPNVLNTGAANRPDVMKATTGASPLQAKMRPPVAGAASQPVAATPRLGVARSEFDPRSYFHHDDHDDIDDHQSLDSYLQQYHTASQNFSDPEYLARFNDLHNRALTSKQPDYIKVAQKYSGAALQRKAEALQGFASWLNDRLIESIKEGANG